MRLISQQFNGVAVAELDAIGVGSGGYREAMRAMRNGDDNCPSCRYSILSAVPLCLPEGKGSYPTSSCLLLRFYLQLPSGVARKEAEKSLQERITPIQDRDRQLKDHDFKSDHATHSLSWNTHKPQGGCDVYRIQIKKCGKDPSKSPLRYMPPQSDKPVPYRVAIHLKSKNMPRVPRPTQKLYSLYNRFLESRSTVRKDPAILG